MPDALGLSPSDYCTRCHNILSTVKGPPGGWAGPTVGHLCETCGWSPDLSAAEVGRVVRVG